MKRPSVICIGAAVQDVFLQGKIFKPHREDDGEMVEEFGLGSKNTIEGVTFSTGGGATNAAVTFARQGMKSSYLGEVGDDLPGRAVKEALHEDGVDTSLMNTSRKFGTGYSALLLAPTGERTILVYRGASAHYKLTVDDFHGKKPDWLYITSLEGNFDVLETALNYAAKNNIKVAINPGKNELKQAGHFRQLLDKITILSLNKEELAMLFDGETLEDLVKNATQNVPYVLGTDGPNGSMAAFDGKIYKAGMYKDVKVIDRTGAGDAFSSGFAAMIAAGKSIEEAMTFASANSTSVVQHIGAKPGILRRDAKLEKMEIQMSDL